MKIRKIRQTMKASLVIACLMTPVSAFIGSQPSATTTVSSTTTALNLFGGKKEGGDKGPGMMDQLNMFKKAQEMATKKKKLDEELKKEPFEGSGADGKVKAKIKYNPIMNPMDPNPDYEVTSFEFDDAYFESSSAEEISAGVKEAIMKGVEATNEAVQKKYATLQSDLMEAFDVKKEE